MATANVAIAKEYEVSVLAIDSIIPSKTNRTVTDSAVAEMAESIKQEGLIYPLIVRPKNGKHEIVCGEVRWRGAKKAGLAEIKVIIKEMSDEDAQREQIIENLQRSNPSPMDEAQSYGNLRKLIGKAATTAVLAAQVGKPEAYIAQRLKLLEAIPAVQDAIKKEQIGLGHALLIAPLDADIQKGVIKWLLAGQEEQVGESYRDRIKTVHTVPALRAFVERNFMLVLDKEKTPFDITDPQLVPKMGACTSCPHNTVNAGALFPDHSKTPTCTLPSCYYEKRNKTVDIKIAELSKETEKPVYRLGLGHSNWNEGPGKVKVDGYLARGSYDSGPRLVKKGDECKSTRTAMLVFKAAGENDIKAQVGAVTEICTNPDCSKHGKGGSSVPRSDGGRKALSGMAFVQHKAKNLGASRAQRVRWAVFKAFAEKLLKTEPPKGIAAQIDIAAKTAAGHLYSDSARDAAKAMGWVKPEGKKTQHTMYEAWGGRFEAFFKGKPWALLVATLAAEKIRTEHTDSDLFRLAKLYKVDIKKIGAEILKADKELIGGMTKRAKEKAAVKPKVKAKAKAKKPEAAVKSAA